MQSTAEADSTLPPVLVVNLLRSPERRARMQRHLDGLGIAHQFVDAVDGRLLSEEERAANYAPRRRRLFFGRDMSPGDIGCILSARGIYREMVEKQIPVAILLEDDVELAPNFMNVIRALMKSPVPWDIVRFISRKKVTKQARLLFPLIGEHVLARPRGLVGGGYAYILTLRAAERLNKRMQHNWMPPDILMSHVWTNGLRSFIVLPSPVIHDDEGESTIGLERFDKTRHLNGVERYIYPITRLGMKLYVAICTRVFMLLTLPRDLYWTRRYARNATDA